MTTPAAIDQMIDHQVRTWSVLEPDILAAMRHVPRELFVPAAWRSLAYADTAVPLASGKHMLTPMLVGRILQTLAVRRGAQVLEVGTGSGYLAACLAQLGGQVRSIELHAPLVAAARANLHAAGITGVSVHEGNGLELAGEPAFDTIVLTGSLPLYQPQFEQALRPGGRLFVVVGSGAVMEARLVQRLNSGQVRSSVLFETSLAALDHAPAPPAFEF